MGVLVRSAARQLCYAARAVIPCTWRGKYFSSGSDEPAANNRVTPMLRHLMYKIKSTGPITVAEYMKEVLTNPAKGKAEAVSDVMIKSLQVLDTEWQSTALGLAKRRGRHLSFASQREYTWDLGAGGSQGYYMHRDMLGEKGDFITSPEISQIFGELLGIWFISEWMATGKNVAFQLVELGPGRGTLMGDILRVFSQLGSVLKNCDISIHLVEDTAFFLHMNFLMFFLCISFRKHPKDGEKYSLILTHKFLHDEIRDHVEVCPDAGVIIQELSERIALTGGAALIADYGHDGTKTDTFRGFCGHELHDVLIAPGTADLTADVDFSYLRRMAQGKVASLGPTEQQTFLKNMGIDVRLKVLFNKSDEPSVRQQLLQGYDMLMNPQKMGERFNFFALLPHERLHGRSHHINACQSRPSASPVAGFGELAWQ
ncbi:protein arginine methyltransferase NDUFAF7, mitochondrial isoform X4 [Heterocephalus glaber]|uniref:Protein arginine methyltransferase NDUFAF7 n=1 Tax=Heterocephalus glaber TaxID=10181 RepID=A0AAX6SIY1_HETGA|nr:protein arginine methyltransferase NDUFAF7, mitochondrial isoform X4 [Heterocephalus glaber]